jgi:hypothetical protein
MSRFLVFPSFVRILMLGGLPEWRSAPFSSCRRLATAVPCLSGLDTGGASKSEWFGVP